MFADVVGDHRVERNRRERVAVAKQRLEELFLELVVSLEREPKCEQLVRELASLPSPAVEVIGELFALVHERSQRVVLLEQSG